jgi:EpsD family peptidyl-prolyl cis-trans isomerase
MTTSRRSMVAARTLQPVALVVIACGVLASCSRTSVPSESQVAARVNDGEISVHQVQAILERQPRLLAASGENTTSRVLEVLIDQELAAQAARAEGLESDPSVIQTLQASRREVLARAHHDRIAARAASPTSDAIDRYYDSHPALFAQRRLYILQETAVEAPDVQVAQLRESLPQWQTAEDLAKALRAAGLRNSTRQFAMAAEDLPLTLLDPLSGAGVGQSALFAQPGGARIFTVLYAQKAPVERRTAADAIARYLASDRQRELVADAMKALRQKAKIQYQGGFVPKPASAPGPDVVASTPS